MVDFVGLLEGSLDEKVKAGVRSATRKKAAKAAAGGGRKRARSA